MIRIAKIKHSNNNFLNSSPLHAVKSYIYYIDQGIIDVATCVNWRD